MTRILHKNQQYKLKKVCMTYYDSIYLRIFKQDPGFLWVRILNNINFIGIFKKNPRNNMYRCTSFAPGGVLSRQDVIRITSSLWWGGRNDFEKY